MHRPVGPRSFLPTRQIEPGLFRAVGETGRVATAADWNARDRTKLWLFTLHYLDDLAAPATALTAPQSDLLDRWIAENPPFHGIGWHPYPTSLRLVNVVKWCSRQPHVSESWLDSIAVQARALHWQIEYEIAANHVFANAKGLIFAGAFLGGPAADRVLTAGLRLLDRQVAEQFLADGGHYERAPAYHALLLWDMLDLIDLAGATRLPELESRVAAWQRVVQGGISWLAAMSHPDGGPAFFNDSALAFAPTLAEVEAYARDLRIVAASEPSDWPRVTHLVESGYIRVEPDPTAALIIDVAPIAPAHQPGHAHADTLSFEMNVRGERLIVNSGISTYADGLERQRQRSTAAHSTVEVDGRNSSDVWKSFRVGRRARPFDVAVSRSGDTITIRASHDGYRHLRGRPVHTRQWTCRPGSLRVHDDVTGGRPAVARYHLHPAITTNGDHFELADGSTVRWTTSGEHRLAHGTWHPQFGDSVPNVCISLPVPPGGQHIDIAW